MDIHTLADLNKRTKRSITSPRPSYDNDDYRNFAALSEDEDSDVMSVDEAEMTVEMQDLIDQDNETVSDDQLLEEIRSSVAFKKLTAFQKARTYEALQTWVSIHSPPAAPYTLIMSQQEEEALEAEKDPDDGVLDWDHDNPEASYAMLPVTATDVDDKAAGTFKYDPGHIYSDGRVEWEIAKMKIKLKREVIIDGEKTVVEEIKTAAKVFADGSIAVRKRGSKGKGKRKNQRKRMRK